CPLRAAVGSGDQPWLVLRHLPAAPSDGDEGGWGPHGIGRRNASRKRQHRKKQGQAGKNHPRSRHARPLYAGANAVRQRSSRRRLEKKVKRLPAKSAISGVK